MNKKQLEKMRKGRVRAQELCGKVIDIEDDVSIWADKDQYIVKYGKYSCYFGTLEECFNDIFKERVRARLVENQKKDMEEIIKIIEDTRKWLKNIFKNTKRVKFE